MSKPNNTSETPSRAESAPASCSASTLRGLAELAVIYNRRAAEYAEARYLTSSFGARGWVAGEVEHALDGVGVTVSENVNYDARERRVIRLACADLDMGENEWGAKLTEIRSVQNARRERATEDKKLKAVRDAERALAAAKAAMEPNNVLSESHEQ